MEKTCYPIFLSLVLVVRNQAASLKETLTEAVAVASILAADYEVIVVDNASGDESVSVLKQLAGIGGLPNIQVFALAKEVDVDTASWAGVENALGDFVVSMNQETDDIDFLPEMLDYAVKGSDVVFAANRQKSPQSWSYLMCSSLFNVIYKWLDAQFDSEAPRFRVMSKRVVNFILQHPVPVMAYRYLPATSGFDRINLVYSATPKVQREKSLWESIERGMSLLVSTTRVPMRLVTALSFFGATSNALYSLYVIGVAILKSDVAPGWVTVSLQQSGMFFLISLVLMVLGEYILQMTRLSNEGPLYYVAQEFTSAVMTRREKLNIEEVHNTLHMVYRADERAS